MTHYSLLIGSAGGGEPATAYTTYGAGLENVIVSVPSEYNAVHFQYAVGGGGGGVSGTSYDKAGGESSGPSGGSGAYLSDVILPVTGGTSYLIDTGSGGAPGNQTANFGHPRTASSGTDTSFGALFSLGGGGGGYTLFGGVQGPLAALIPGGIGNLNLNVTPITSGFFFNSSYDLITIGNVSELQGGPVGTFNQSGNGTAGASNGNCGGDNCRIGGANGGASYGGAVAGGIGGNTAGSTPTAGTRGSGGAGGAAEIPGVGGTPGAYGGGGEMKFRFIDIFGT